jgi:hypothetical protein
VSVQPDDPAAPDDAVEVGVMPAERARRGDNGREGDLSTTVVTVLLAIVTLTGAVLTGRAVLLDDQAGDTDRRAVIETAMVERSRAGAEVGVGGEAVLAIRWEALQSHAQVLEDAARRARNRREPARAEELTRHAEALLAVAGEYADIGPHKYVAEGRRLDVDRQLAIEVFGDEATAKLNPDRTAEQADSLHRRANAVVLWVVVLGALVLVLTVARLVRTSLRIALVGMSAGVFVVATALAVLEAA